MQALEDFVGGNTHILVSSRSFFWKLLKKEKEKKRGEKVSVCLCF